MAAKIRLARYGKKKNPFYKIVVIDSASPRNGRYLEKIGTYDPCSNPVAISIEKDKALDWLKKGAKPTQTADQILRKGGVFKK
jgi:small subunit ribosomal protein S16